MVAKETAGGLKGYSVGNLSLTRNVPCFITTSVTPPFLFFFLLLPSCLALRPGWGTTYVKWRSLGSVHVDLPVVEIGFVGQLHLDAFGRGFDELR